MSHSKLPVAPTYLALPNASWRIEKSTPGISLSMVKSMFMPWPPWRSSSGMLRVSIAMFLLT